MRARGNKNASKGASEGVRGWGGWGLELRKKHNYSYSGQLAAANLRPLTDRMF